MKSALCLSGHLRSFQKTYFHLKKNILDPLGSNTDIFIFSWDRIGFDSSDRGDSHLMSAMTNSSQLTQLYHPKKMTIETMESWDTRKYMGKIGAGVRNPQIVFGLFYGISIANKLKKQYELENNFTYDVVIRARPDLLFHNQLQVAEIEAAKNNDGIFVPKFGNYSGICDQFAFGNSISMNKYAETYQNIDKMFDDGLSLHPETMLKKSIESYNLPIFRSSIEYSLLRANGAVFNLARD